MYQGLIMFVVSLAMIPLLEQYLGLPYEVALAFVVIGNALALLPALLGVPLVPGWITPAIPLVLVFLGDFEPGPEAIQAMFALQFMVAILFLLMGLTGLGAKLVRLVPKSLQAGIIIGAGIAAIIGEIQEGGRLANTPISLTLGLFIAIFLMFSVSFSRWVKHYSLARRIANYGLVPSTLIAILIAWSVGEYPLPSIEWGITRPNFSELWSYLPFVVGFPSLNVFLLAVPTALITYVIAFGDIVVGHALIARVDEARQDEKIECDTNRVHYVTAIRNFGLAFFAPFPGLAGPIWTALTATVAERYKFGRHAMDSIYGGAGTLMITLLLALFFLPLVSLFQPVLPIALSMALILTGYICLMVGMEQVTTATERGVAGTTAVVLAIYGAGWGIVIGLALYYLVEKQNLLGREAADDEAAAPKPLPSETVPTQNS